MTEVSRTPGQNNTDWVSAVTWSEGNTAQATAPSNNANCAHVTQARWLHTHKRSVLVLNTTASTTMVLAPFNQTADKSSGAIQSQTCGSNHNPGGGRAESGSAACTTLARERLCGAAGLCNTTLIQTSVPPCRGEKYSGGLSLKVCLSVTACQRIKRSKGVRAHVREQDQSAKTWCESATACLPVSIKSPNKGERSNDLMLDYQTCWGGPTLVFSPVWFRQWSLCVLWT